MKLISPISLIFPFVIFSATLSELSPYHIRLVNRDFRNNLFFLLGDLCPEFCVLQFKSILSSERVGNPLLDKDNFSNSISNITK